MCNLTNVNGRCGAAHMEGGEGGVGVHVLIKNTIKLPFSRYVLFSSLSVSFLLVSRIRVHWYESNGWSILPEKEDF